MKVLVTGGNGLIGRYIVGRLAQDHEVIVVDHRTEERPGVVSYRADVLDLASLKGLMVGCSAVVHLAAIPHPLGDPPEDVFRTNTMGTFNVLEAAAWNRVRRVVFMSSESVLGFAFSGGKILPEYFPVDERHPLRPLDPYGLSKTCGELMCDAFARRGTLTTICLRPPWIWVPEESEIRKYQDLLGRPDAWPQTLWAYVHVADVAEAVVSALVCEVPPGSSQKCFLSASENWTGQDSRELARRHYPGTKILEPERAGPYSLLSNLHAWTLLGFKPRYSLNDLPGLEHS